MAPKYILNYFDAAGRGGVEFTDNRMDKETWQKNKPDSELF